MTTVGSALKITGMLIITGYKAFQNFSMICSGSGEESLESEKQAGPQ